MSESLSFFEEESAARYPVFERQGTDGECAVLVYHFVACGVDVVESHFVVHCLAEVVEKRFE